MTPDLSLDVWARIRFDYEHTTRPIEEICAEHGISSGTLRDRMRRWNWTRRRTPIPLEGPPSLPWPAEADAAVLSPTRPIRTSAEAPSPANGELASVVATDHDTNAEPLDAEEIGERLQVAVSRVIPAIEQAVDRLTVAPAHPRHAEQAARAVAVLTRTLRELTTLAARYPTPPPDHDEQVQAMRESLFHRINALITQREDNEGGNADAANAEAGTSEAEVIQPEEAPAGTRPSVRLP
jgi:hypothetical protein